MSTAIKIANFKNFLRIEKKIPITKNPKIILTGAGKPNINEKNASISNHST